MAATAGIVIIGDEILTGKFADENAAFLIGELRALGVDLRRIVVIPDDLDDIAATVVDMASRVTYAFTSGGVGPTHDDVTMAGIAKGFGTRIVRNDVLEAKVRGYWKDKLHEPNLRLADVPEGSELVYGSGDVWPVVSYRNVYILPGVPPLFRRKFVDIRDRFRAEPVATARAYVAVDEGEIADDLTAVVASFPSVKVGSYPRFSETEFRVMITFEGRVHDEVAAALAMLVDRLGTRLVRFDHVTVAGS